MLYDFFFISNMLIREKTLFRLQRISGLLKRKKGWIVSSRVYNISKITILVKLQDM